MYPGMEEIYSTVASHDFQAGDEIARTKSPGRSLIVMMLRTGESKGIELSAGLFQNLFGFQDIPATPGNIVTGGR